MCNCCTFEIGYTSKLLCMHNIYKTTGQHQRMQAQRIKYLQEEIENFPEDPFNYYALALEYISGAPQEAERLFGKLLSDFPDYLPVYYQSANYHFEKGDYSKAGELFTAGIALAEKQKNEKALRELKGSYSIFKTETDDEF